VSERAHEVLGFCNGAFKGSQVSWSTFDKEAWALVSSILFFQSFLRNMDQAFYVHTDHKNLVYIFDAEKFSPKKQTRDRVTRWSLMLSSFNYILEHIEGDNNLMADILSRWMTNMKAEPVIATIHEVNERNEDNNIVSSDLTYENARSQFNIMHDEQLKLPSNEEIFEVQMKTLHVPQDISSMPVNGQEISFDNVIVQYDERKHAYVTKEGKLWIPSDAQHLKVCLIVLAHSGLNGHCTTSATLKKLMPLVFWSNMNNEVKIC
jgi:hypothetical protein